MAEQQISIVPNIDVRDSYILVVDDEPQILKLLCRLLENEGYFVDSVETSEKALEQAKKEEYNLFIVDKNLPGMSGIDAIRFLRRMQPHAEFIVVTGYASLGSAVDALRLGVFDYIEKPFSKLDTVATKVKRALEKQRLLFENKVLADHLRTSEENIKAIQTKLEDSMGDADKLKIYVDEMVKRLTLELQEENLELKRAVTNVLRIFEKLKGRLSEATENLEEVPPALHEVLFLVDQIWISSSMQRITALESDEASG